MLFAHDTTSSLQSAVWLVNSAERPDALTTPEQADGWFAEFAHTGRRDGDRAELRSLRALRSLRSLRPALRELLTSERDRAAALVNTLLADARAVPQLVRHEPFDWHVHVVPADSQLATRVLVETAMAMIDVIRADELSRISTCADGDCDAVVLDLSRNRSRRFCSITCGNRIAVAAYRARRASGKSV